MLGPLAFILLLQSSADGRNFQEALRPAASTPGPGPYYDEFFSGNVTVLLGTKAELKCRVKQASNVTVSWLRVADVPTLLSVGTYTYTMDNRVRVSHNSLSSEWTLALERTTHNDTGVYDCQVGTTPPLTRHIYLTVVEPDTEVIGGPEIFIDQRSTINLTCVIEHAPQPPSFILWEHNSKTISYDSDRGGISVVTTKGRTTVSQLLIRHARPPDSGRYTCKPASSKPASVRVHVLKGGQRPEAMHTGGGGDLRPARTPLLLLLLLLTLLPTLLAGMVPALADRHWVTVR